MRITIRRAVEKDLDAVLAMEKTSARNPWTRAQRAQELVLPYAHFWVAEADGILAGLLDIHLVAGDAHINDVITDVRFRRQGVAAALLAQALDSAKKFGCAAVTLEVRENNSAALALYRQAGFHKIARKRDFYTNPPDHAICMQKFLDSKEKDN